MPLRLHVPTHDTEAHIRLSILGDEGWNDGVKGTLVWREGIWMLRVNHIKTLTSVLKHETQPIWCHTASHATIIALDERDHGPFTIGYCHVNGIALESRIPGLEFQSRLIKADELATLGGE